jgi:hypothetical protein
MTINPPPMWLFAVVCALYLVAVIVHSQVLP